MNTVVPVFVYHSVSDHPAPWSAPRAVTRRAFADQLDRLAAAGRTVIPLRRLVSAVRGGVTLPDDAAVLTFDDGYEDFYWTTAPILSERGLPATVYITTGAVHSPGRAMPRSLLPPAAMLNWRQIGTLDALGFEIGGHSRTHAQLDIVPARRLAEEIGASKRELEEAVGHAVTAFSYPGGYSSPAVHRALAAAGWTSGATVGNAFSSAADNPYRIPRLLVTADTAPARFQQWAEGRGAGLQPLAESLSTRGGRAYRRTRARLGHPIAGSAVD
ncbi:polysaccharide deacetylase family protein [Kitasatospora sp. NBC_00315]|uniref:polysaccharide deacetylase family protein n=1 Tax=Kitasatospora sp. NBC_00315 TaxID=2975963 RepID=UPI003246C238